MSKAQNSLKTVHFWLNNVKTHDRQYRTYKRQCLPLTNSKQLRPCCSLIVTINRRTKEWSAAQRLIKAINITCSSYITILTAFTHEENTGKNIMYFWCTFVYMFFLHHKIFFVVFFLWAAAEKSHNLSSFPALSLHLPSFICSGHIFRELNGSMPAHFPLIDWNENSSASSTSRQPVVNAIWKWMSQSQSICRLVAEKNK